jgi:hypothetical protein
LVSAGVVIGETDGIPFLSIRKHQRKMQWVASWVQVMDPLDGSIPPCTHNNVTMQCLRRNLVWKHNSYFMSVGVCSMIMLVLVMAKQQSQFHHRK